ncbi:MAG: hypothetical protein AAFQ32_13325 [Pseudomonadota bacterium]
MSHIPLLDDFLASVENQAFKTAAIANFKQVVKDGDLRLHPMSERLVDQGTLENIGARQGAEKGGA